MSANDPATNKSSIALTKHHGLGNDFLIAVDPPRPLDGADALHWCDRRTGIGADGLIVASPLSEQARSEAGTRRWRMVLWNSDGGRAEISGNGIRCLGQAIAEHLGLDRSLDQEITIDTDAGTRELTIKALGPDAPSEGDGPVGDAPPTADFGTMAMVRAGMGKALAGPEPSERWPETGVEIQTQQGVDIGNPHLVAFVESLEAADMASIGPIIEADYPSGLNVHLVTVEDRSRLDLRVWERGAGVTRACGSGACAAAWAANTLGFVDALVTVDMPGGSAQVELTEDEIFLIGPAVKVGAVIVNG